MKKMLCYHLEEQRHMAESDIYHFAAQNPTKELLIEALEGNFDGACIEKNIQQILSQNEL